MGVRNRKVNKKGLAFFILGSGAIAGVTSWAMSVKEEMAPLLQKIEEQKQIIQEQEEEIKKLQEGGDEARLVIEQKQIEESIEDVEQGKHTAQPHDNGETPDGVQYGFQYCPNGSGDPGYSGNCKKYYYDLQN